MPSDVDTDFPPQTAMAHPCMNERRIRTLERKDEEKERRLLEGALLMQALQSSTDAQSESLDRLHTKVDKIAAMPPIAPIVVHAPAAPEPTAMQKAGDAAIHWLVPIVLGALAWAIASSGMIRVGTP